MDEKPKSVGEDISSKPSLKDGAERIRAYFTAQPEKSLERPVSREEELIKKYEVAVRGIVAHEYADYKRDRDWGIIKERDQDGIHIRVLNPYRAGKQQKVIVLELTFLEGDSFEVVCKEDLSHMCEKQKENLILQKYLPKIYFEEQGIAVVQKVNGLELDQYEQAMKDDETVLPKVVEGAIEIMTAFAHSSFRLSDVEFIRGHNVMLDAETKKPKLFDIHSMDDWKSSYEEKMLFFLNKVGESLGAYEKKQQPGLPFLAGLIREYQSKHKQEVLSYQGKEERRLMIGDPGYDEAFKRYQETDEMGDMAERGDVMDVVLEGRIFLSPAVIEASEQNDLERLKQLVKERKGRVTELVTE